MSLLLVINKRTVFLLLGKVFVNMSVFFTKKHMCMWLVYKSNVLLHESFHKYSYHHHHHMTWDTKIWLLKYWNPFAQYATRIQNIKLNHYRLHEPNSSDLISLDKIRRSWLHNDFNYDKVKRSWLPNDFNLHKHNTIELIM